MLPFQAIRDFCASRLVDLRLIRPPDGFTLALHGEFDGYGDFFTLVARDIEYVDLPGGFPFGELVFTHDVRDLEALAPKWATLSQDYSGPAVAFRSADASSWGSDRYCFAVIANTLEWRAGRDWPAVSPTEGP